MSESERRRAPPTQDGDDVETRRREVKREAHPHRRQRSSDESDAATEEYRGSQREQSIDRRMPQRLTMTFKDVEGTLDAFSPDDGRNIKRWIEEFEETALLCDWSDVHKAIYARRLLRGSAKLFISFENCRQSWVETKKALVREFSPEIDSYELHRRLQRRKKKNDESYHEYCYRMMEIGAQIGMEQSAVVQHIIEGIDGDEVSKMVLLGARNIPELKVKLDLYEKIKDKAKTSVKLDSSQKKAPSTNVDTKSDKCFNCGIKGHMSRKCPTKSKGPKCFN